MTAGELHAGPRVATIFVLRDTMTFRTMICRECYGNREFNETRIRLELRQAGVPRRRNDYPGSIPCAL